MSTFLVTCSSCGSTNRVPGEKEGMTARCGKCGATFPPLYFHPREVSEKSFDEFVRGFDAPVLAEFWAPW